MKIYSQNSLYFNSRNIYIRKADDIARHVNKTFPMFKPSYAIQNWKILNTSQQGKNQLRIDFYKKHQGRVFAMRDEYRDDCSISPFEMKMLQCVKEQKMGNCYESALITLGALFANGFEKSKKVSPRVVITGIDTRTKQTVISKSFPIDHTCVLTSMNNSKKEAVDRAIVIDSWLNKAMSVPEAKEEFKKLISKRELAGNFSEVQQELKWKLGRKKQGEIFVENKDFDLNNYEFKYDIHFVSDQDFVDSEIKQISQDIRKKYPQLIMDFLA